MNYKFNGPSLFFGEFVPGASAIQEKGWGQYNPNHGSSVNHASDLMLGVQKEQVSKLNRTEISESLRCF